ncbi:MAG: glutamate--tRNA ligase family protein, partial [Pseudomonadota bacterium]
YADAIRKDLQWLGIEWSREIKQSDRFALYDAVVEALKAAGRLYPCYETPDELDLKRKMQLAQRKPPVYDRAALALTDTETQAFEAEGRRPHWRFKLIETERVEWVDLVRGDISIDMASLSDPIVVREDGSYLYMLPSVVDDIDCAITHVVRGEDHVANSAVQVQMFEALGGSAPTFAHAALITAEGGEGLSKRLGSAGMAYYRDAGFEPLALVALLARLGTADPIEAVASQAPLVETFDFARFGRAAAKFSETELKAINARIVHDLPFHDVKDRLPAAVDETFWLAVRGNLEMVGDVKDWLAMVEGPVSVDTPPEDIEYLAAAHDALPDAPLTLESWGVWTNALKTSTGRKGRGLFMPLRLALTGMSHGPEMATLLPLIGHERAKARLKAASAG